MDGEVRFGTREFERARRLIREFAGVSLSSSKRSLVRSRLARRLRATRIAGFAEYLDCVERDASEREAFVNALTTNLTSFFREPHHFDILSKKLEASGLPRSLRIWSCAASTGEEPYSIAMCVAEMYGTLPSDVEILATDINTEVLRVATAGIYPAEAVAALSPLRRRRFFLRGIGRNAGKVAVSPALRAIVRVERCNLLEDDWPTTNELDAVFCRNVMIYFDKATQRELVARITKKLRPGGLLFLGHSETIFEKSSELRSAGRTAYERVAIRE